MAIRGIRVARTGIYERGARVRVSWIPGHRGLEGNELADACARNEAERAELLRKARSERKDTIREKRGKISLAYIKGQARKEANREWREIITRLSREQGNVMARKRRDEIPRIPAILQKTPKALASRFFQLASGHAMIAPFLKEKFGWIDSDICWWYTKSRQTREHLFKECSAWKQEIRRLWKEVEEATKGQNQGDGRNRYKGKKGFGFFSETGRGRGRGRGPGNTPVKVLMADERCIPAVLSFLSSTKCGQVKEGVLLERGMPQG